MDLSRQSPRAAEIHTEYLLSGERSCIDCHKGIAHEFPDMTGVAPGWTAPDELQGERLPGLTPAVQQGTEDFLNRSSE